MLDRVKPGGAQALSSKTKPQKEQPLAGALARLEPHWYHQWAWDNYKRTVIEVAQEYGLTRLCEIGGGRDPLLRPDEARRLGFDIVVNDIDQHELDWTPTGFDTACFDIAGDVSRFPKNSYDMMFSKMVFEHVRDVEQAWKNVHRLLKPGGIGFAFFPTLYAPPFVLNRIIPEGLSSRILTAVFPDRRDDGMAPKFPAYYDWSYGSEARVAPMLKGAGFREAVVQPFWGHDYFKPVPGLRQLSDSLTRMCARKDWRSLTTYAFVLVRK